MIEGKRIDYIDISKGLGMLAIIWGHIMLSGWSNHLVYGFDIPLFFFLSGMVYNHKKYNSLPFLLKRRARTLIKPYIIFSVVTWLIWVVYNSFLHNQVESFINPLIQTLIAQGSGGYLVHNVPLWFVTCLLFIEIVYYFIRRYTIVLLNLAICVVCAVVGYLMILPNDFFDFKTLPWSIEAGLSALIFYSSGNLLISYIGHEKILGAFERNKVYFIMVMLALFVVLFIGTSYNGHVTLATNILGKNPAVFYLTGFCGLSATIIFSIVCQHLKGKGFFSGVINAIQWIGSNSFFFMAIHVPIKGFVVVVLAKLLKLESARLVQTSMEYSFLAFVVTLIVSTFIIVLINRWISFYNAKFSSERA